MSDLTDRIRASEIFPPEAVIHHAEAVTVTPGTPFAGVTVHTDETGQTVAQWRGHNITPDYEEWRAEQPRHHEVTITWPVEKEA